MQNFRKYIIIPLITKYREAHCLQDHTERDGASTEQIFSRKLCCVLQVVCRNKVFCN